MGVLGLWQIIDSVGHPIKLEGLEGKRLGVDANIWLYKFVRGFREKDNATNIDAHKLGLFNRISKLLYYKIKPVFVFDGPAPILKRRTLEKRQNLRTKELIKAQNTAMKLLTDQLKKQYPSADTQKIKFQLPELKTNNLVAAEKLTDEDRTLFYLPPTTAKDDEDGDFSSDADDYEPEDVKYRKFDRKCIKREFLSQKVVDIESEAFKSLPPEIRYEILTDIRDEKRRIKRHEAMPENAEVFSTFQLQRLKEKRVVQEKIEECEREICRGESNGNMQSFRVQSDSTQTILYGSKVINVDHKNYDNYINSKIEKLVKEKESQQSSDAKEEFPCTMEKPNITSIRPVASKLDISEAKKKLTENLKLLKKPQNAAIESDGSIDKSSDDEMEPNLPDYQDKRASIVASTETVSLVDEESTKNDNKDYVSKFIDDFVGYESDTEDELDTQHPLSTTIDLVSAEESVIDLGSEKPEDISFMSDEETESDNEESQPKLSNTIDLVEIDDSVRESIAQKESEIFLVSSDDEKIDDLAPEKVVIENSSPSITQDVDHNNKFPRSEQEVVKEKKNVEIQCKSGEAALKSQVKVQQPVTRSDIIVEPEQTTSQETMDIPTTKTSNSSARVTDRVIAEAKELLRLFGVPYIDAAGEAEAQCALLEELKLTDGTITDDSDVWLFGAKNVYRHFFSDDKYVLQYKMMDIEFHVRLTRDNLICFAMLVGSDYTDGIMNVGPVTALEILSEFPGYGLEPLLKFKEWKDTYTRSEYKKKREHFLKLNLPDQFPSKQVFDGYMQPTTDMSEDKFTWGTPELDELREYARRNFGWDMKKIDEKLLPVMKKINERSTQPTIDNFFFKRAQTENPELFRSKRINKALTKIKTTTSSSQETDVVMLSELSENSDEDREETKKTKKRPQTKRKPTKATRVPKRNGDKESEAPKTKSTRVRTR